MEIKKKYSFLVMMLLCVIVSVQSYSNSSKDIISRLSPPGPMVCEGTNKEYHDSCPTPQLTGYTVCSVEWEQVKQYYKWIIADEDLFENHFEETPVLDGQNEVQQWVKTGNTTAYDRDGWEPLDMDKYVGVITCEPDMDDETGVKTSILKWQLTANDVQKLYQQWNRETQKKTEKTYELKVAAKYVDKHGAYSDYMNVYVVFNTKVTFKPYSITDLNVKVDWSAAKISNFWYQKNTAEMGADELHTNVPSVEDELRNDADSLTNLFSNEFLNNQVVNRSIVTGGTGFNYNNYKYRLVFDESNKGKQFMGASGTTYTLTVSADGRQLRVGNTLIAELVLPNKFADKAGDIEEANYTMIKYAHSKIAHDLLNYCSHKEFDNQNDEVLNNFLNVVISLAIQNDNNCAPIKVENGTFNVRFLRPIDANVTSTAMQEENSGSKLSLYLNNVFEIKDWRGLWKDGYNDYYGIQGAKIDGLNDGDLLSTNRNIKINLNHTGMKPLYQVGGQIDFIYHEDNALGSYIEFYSNVSAIQNLKLEIPVVIEYIWGKITTTVTVTVIDGGEQGVVLNAANFPDADFRAALAEKLKISEGDEITDEMIQQTTELRFGGAIADLAGIEYFTALRHMSYVPLHCFSGHLTSLDLSKNTALVELECSGSGLTSLDLSKNTALAFLKCSDNYWMTELNISGCSALEWLYCYNNQLTSLDVSRNTALTGLYCYGNRLTSLDVSKNTALTSLSCYDNQLTSLDVSQNIALTSLYCAGNQLTSLDVSGCTALTWLDCSSNQLASLDVSQNTALWDLRCYGNQIKGEAMDALVASLPTVESGRFYVINTKDENEGNVCTKAQVAVAKEKGWTVYDYNYDGSNWVGSVEYEGSDEAILLDEENFPDDNFRNAIAKELGLSEGSEINEGLIVATTKLDVSDGKITELSGIEYFTALTTIYCQINQISDKAMTSLIGALPDLSGNEAKGLMLTEETNSRKGALYALDFTDENEQNVCTAEHVAAANPKGWTVYCKTSGDWQEYNGEIPTGINTVDSGELTVDSWYTIDGKKLAGEPKEKGIYIRNGRKVVK